MTRGPSSNDMSAPTRLETACATCLAAAFFAFFAWPWVHDMGTTIPDAAQRSPAWGADARLIVWILAWDAHAIGTASARFFDANIYHPIPAMLTGSEHLLSAVVFSGPVYALTGNPILAANVAAMSTYVLGVVVAYALMRTLGLSVVAAGVAGAAFALGPLQVPADLHVLQYPAWALALVLLVAVRSARTRRFGWVLPAVTFAVFSSYYMAAMTGVLLAFESVVTWLTRGPRRALSLLAAATPAFAILAVFSMPYLAGTTSRSQSFVAPAAAFARIWAVVLDPGNLYPGFGWGLIGLAGAGLLLPVARRRRPGMRWWRWIGLVLLGAGLAAPYTVTLGTVEVPMPSMLLSYTPLRGVMCWLLLAHLGLVGLAAESAEACVGWIARHATPAMHARALVGVALLAVVSVPRADHLLDQPLTVLPTPDTVPAAYRWLAANARGPLLDLPGPVGTTWLRQADTMVLSIYHWLPLLNGHTGYPPWAYQAVIPEFARLPGHYALQMLVDLTELQWVLVRRGRVPQDVFAAWEAFARDDDGVQAVQYGGSDLLLRVTLRPRHPWAQALARGRPEAGRTALGTLLTPLDEATVQGRITSLMPRRVRAGATSRVRVRVANTGWRTWPALIAPGAPETGVVRLRTRWRAPDGRVVGESLHAIPRDVASGQSLRFVIEVAAPEQSGKYDLEVGVTQRGGAPMDAVLSEPLPVVVRNVRSDRRRHPRRARESGRPLIGP